MSNNDEENQPGTGEGTKLEDESTTGRDHARFAGPTQDFDDDTEEAITLPKVRPEVTDDDDADKKSADSAFDDLEIEIDEADLIAESENQPSGRKY